MFLSPTQKTESQQITGKCISVIPVTRHLRRKRMWCIPAGALQAAEAQKAESFSCRFDWQVYPVPHNDQLLPFIVSHSSQTVGIKGGTSNNNNAGWRALAVKIAHPPTCVGLILSGLPGTWSRYKYLKLQQITIWSDLLIQIQIRFAL
jgi:hypothetical protein